MVVFAIGIKLPDSVPVQGLHHADPREHRRASQRHDQDQGSISRSAGALYLSENFAGRTGVVPRWPMRRLVAAGPLGSTECK